MALDTDGMAKIESLFQCQFVHRKTSVQFPGTPLGLPMETAMYCGPYSSAKHKFLNLTA